MIDKSVPDIYSDFAEFYDLYVGDWLHDLPCYLEYAREAHRPVLEIGAGSGRLTIPLARAGISVVAVDVSPSMLQLLDLRVAREPASVRQRIQSVRGDVCELSLGTQHDLIMLPFYAFNYLLTPDAQRRALERLSAHRVAAGHLLIDVFIPYGRIEHCPSEPILKVDKPDPRTGHRVRGWNAYRMDPQRQIETRHHIFEITRPSGTMMRKEFTTRRRYSFPAELETLFTGAGFRIDDVSTGYSGGRPDAASEQLLYVLKGG